jgi:hypothetical protein
MRIKLNFKFVIAFMALTFVMHEAHEIVHTSIARLICGCWGQRDFNVWQSCADCDKTNPYALWATFAGPAFTFIIIWSGAFLLKRTNSNQQKSLGIALIFANMPIGRLINPIFGGGDEVMVLDHFVNNWNLSRIIIVLLVLTICSYPFYKAIVTVQNKWRILYFMLFLLMPLIIDILVVLGLLNNLLNNGVLSDYWILGSPMIVTVWTFFVLAVFILSRKNIYTLAHPNQ